MEKKIGMLKTSGKRIRKRKVKNLFKLGTEFENWKDCVVDLLQKHQLETERTTFPTRKGSPHCLYIASIHPIKYFTPI